MFEFVRTHKKWMQVLLAALIVPSFLVVGVASYGNGAGAGANEVANVGGLKITQQEWEEAQRRQLDNARAQLGERFDPKMFESAESKQAVLDSLIQQRAIEAEIAKSHMTIGDAALQKEIAGKPYFTKPDGSFDMDQYKTILGQQGITPRQYDAQVRRELAFKQINNAIETSGFVPRTVSSRLAEFIDQEREVQELLFPVAEFLPQVKVTDEMVKAYYDKNASLFQVPEQVKAEYVVFDATAVESQVTVSDADAQKYYDANKDKSFTTPEQRRVSHILINVKKDASAADKAAAKAKAEAVLAEVRKTPANFAEIAKAQSQDTSSAEVGGDLGVAEKGQFASAEMESVAFKLKQGEISDLVQSDFGYHIVTVSTLTPPAVKSFDEAKPQIIAELKKSQMSKKYSELAEVFTNTVYEQSDSLKPVADKLQLKIQTVDNLSRNVSPALGTAPVNNAKFLKAIFADDALKNKRNTDAVEVAPSTLVAGRVVEYKPAAKRPLAEVDAVIRQRVSMEEALKLAKKAGEAKIVAAKASNDATGFGEPKVLTRTKQPEIQMAAAADVLKADVSKLPAYVGVDVPGVGYGVYRINKVSQPAQPDMTRRAGLQQQLNALAAQQDTFAYFEALKTKAKTKVTAKPAQVAAADAK